MISRDNLMTARFRLNMERIHGLAKLIMADVALLKPKDVFKSEGPRADILRAIVVFLHAAFEDVLRTIARPDGKKLAFYSGADINKALHKCGLDPTPFKPLYPPLTQMAKRRNRIVHHADLSKQTDTTSGTWTIVDDWQLIMWLLAVPAFHSLLRTTIDYDDKVERATYGRLRKAMDDTVAFGHQLIAFSNVPPELRIEALRKISESLNSISAQLVATKSVSESTLR
ncbi:MAG: hypothetical protein QOJ40_746 [Verrucomicrobiota bacterium]